MYIRKRDGKLQNFDTEKILIAIDKAFKDVGEYDGIQDDIVEEVNDWASNWPDETELDIEFIQDYVETVLMDLKYYEEARAYMLYRYEHSLLRKDRNSLARKIANKLDAKNVTNQNANVDEYSFGGRVGEASRIVTKEYALENCMSKMARENHLNNEIYIHDLDSYAVGQHNCLSIPFDDLLEKGFKTRQVNIRPANSINTAFQLVAVIFQIQSLQQFGGVSATHLDWTMVPYVRKSFYKHFKDGDKYIAHLGLISPEISADTPINSQLYTIAPEVYRYALDMTERELKQAVEGMYHNLNSLQSRSGN